MKPTLGLILFTLALAGCSQVTLKPKGQAVKIGYAGNVQNCVFLGTVEASTQAKVVIERSASAVQEELYILARNHAGSMGATNLVQHGMPQNGIQTFSAYDCPQIS